MIGWIVGLSIFLGYCLANLLWFLDGLVKGLDKPGQVTPNLPDDEPKWRAMLEKKQKN